MSEADIFEVRIKKIMLAETGVEGTKKVSAILTTTWHYPRQNTTSVSTETPLRNLARGKPKTFAAGKYIESLLFKQTRNGASYFTFKVDVVRKKGLFEKLISALVSTKLGMITGPFLKAGATTLFGSLKITEKSITTIAEGYCAFEAVDDTIGDNGQVGLQTPNRPIYVYGEAEYEDEDEEIDQIRKISPRSDNGFVELSFKKLT